MVSISLDESVETQFETIRLSLPLSGDIKAVAREFSVKIDVPTHTKDERNVLSA